MSFLTLPIELIYRILDQLDDFTMISSMRNVCTHINTIVDTYHRYQVNCIHYNHVYNFIQTLTTLDLKHHYIGDERTQRLANALQQNKVIPSSSYHLAQIPFSTDNHYTSLANQSYP